jgi:pentatricopeptide repeat protein
MPLRPKLLRTRGLSSVGFPILPFLAPRVFASWPSRGRRAQFSTQIASKPDKDRATPVKYSPILPELSGTQVAPRGVSGDEAPAQHSAVPIEVQSNIEVASRHSTDCESSWPSTSVTDQANPSSGIFSRRTSTYVSPRPNRAKSKAPRPKIFPVPDGLKERYGELWGNRLKSGTEIESFDKIPAIERQDAPEIPQPRRIRPGAQQPAVLKHGRIRYRRPQRTLALNRWNPAPIIRARPTRMISSRYSEFRNHSAEGLYWHKAFALLNHKHERYIQNGYESASCWLPMTMELKKNDFPLVFKRALIDHEGSDSLRASWELIPKSERLKLWPELMLTTLEEHPNSALKVLIATYFDPYPPDYAVSNCVDFIISHYFSGSAHNTYSSDRSPDANIINVFNTIVSLLRNGPPHYVRLSQHSILLFILNLDRLSVQRLYEDLTELGHLLKENTLIQFASFFAKSGNVDLALDILKRMLKGGVTLSTQKMSSLCATLLAKKGWTAADADAGIFASMLEGGLKPNRIIYNILIRNYLQDGDYETGMRLYNKMLENGIQPSHYTYSILLNDAKVRQDVTSIRQNIRVIMNKKLFYNAYIMTDVLHATYLLHQREQAERGSIGPGEDRYVQIGESRDSAFDALLPIFCEFFDLKPLARLIPRFKELYPHAIEYTKRQPPLTEGKSFTKLPFTAPAIHVMITAYFQGISQPSQISTFYRSLRGYASEGDPAIIRLLRSTHTYNAVLMSLGRFSETVPICPGLVEFMLKRASGKSEFASTHEQDATPTSTPAIDLQRNRVAGIRGASPDVYTWSILLNIFMLHRQPRAAEKVLDLMTSRGITPTIVTWNSLANGYVSLQDTSMTVLTLERLQRAGLQADQITLDILFKLRDRGSLIETLRRMETREKSKDPTPSEKKTMRALSRTLKAEEDVYELVEGEGLKWDETEAADSELQMPVVRDIAPLVRGTV